MKEAQLECLTTQHSLNDLGLVLAKGQKVWVARTRARNSTDLTLAVRIGAIRVQWVERSKVSKKPAPPWVRLSRVRGSGSPTKEASPNPRTVKNPAPVRPAQPDFEARVAQEVEKQVSSMRADLLAGMRDLLVEMQPKPVLNETQLASLVERSVRKVVSSGMQVPSSGPAPLIGFDDVPVFIPSKIMTGKIQANIDLEEEVSSTSDVDAAAKALSKKKTTRRRRKTRPEEKSDG